MWSHDRPRDVDWLMGEALAVRAAAFRQLGGFWPHLGFVPDARVVHAGNHALAQLWSSSEPARQVAIAELTFLRTHYPPSAAAGSFAMIWPFWT